MKPNPERSQQSMLMYNFLAGAASWIPVSFTETG